MPTKTWVVGEEVLAADFNTMVQRQVVATFANAAARTAALPAPTEGMLTYLADVDQYQFWDGATWKVTYGSGISLGPGQVAMAGTYTGQPLRWVGWVQSMGGTGDGSFACAFPTPVNGVLVAHVQAVTPYAFVANVTGASVGGITGIAFNTATNAPVTDAKTIAYMALVW